MNELKDWQKAERDAFLDALYPEAKVVPPFAEPASQHGAWISVEDKLPNKHRTCYLVFVPQNQCQFTAYYDVDYDTDEEGWFHFNIRGGKLEHPVSHWMHMPAKPKLDTDQSA